MQRMLAAVAAVVRHQIMGKVEVDMRLMEL